MKSCVICNTKFQSNYTTEFCDECAEIYEDDAPCPICEICDSCKKEEATSKIGDHFMCDDCRDALVRIREKLLNS